MTLSQLQGVVAIDAFAGMLIRKTLETLTIMHANRTGSGQALIARKKSTSLPSLGLIKGRSQGWT
jgi:hypothetical protein